MAKNLNSNCNLTLVLSLYPYQALYSLLLCIVLTSRENLGSEQQKY